MVVIMTYGFGQQSPTGQRRWNDSTEECSWVLFPLQSRGPYGKGWEEDGRREPKEINPENQECRRRREIDLEDEGRSRVFTHRQSECPSSSLSVTELNDSCLSEGPEPDSADGGGGGGGDGWTG